MGKPDCIFSSSVDTGRKRVGDGRASGNRQWYSEVSLMQTRVVVGMSRVCRRGLQVVRGFARLPSLDQVASSRGKGRRTGAWREGKEA